MTTATLPPAAPSEGDRLTLEMIEQIAASGELTEQQKQAIERHARGLVLRTAEEPARLWEVWSRLCELAVVGGLDVLAPRREQLASSLALKEDMVRRGLDLAGRLERLLGHPLEGADKLPPAAEQLRLFRTEILDRWQSTDDLAEMLIERISLPEDRLKALAAAYPPPPRWYEEDFDPFTPDPAG